MNFHDEWLNDCTDPTYQAAFRAYFGELGVAVTNWNGLFAEIGAGADVTLLRRDETGRVIGFLLCVATEATAWNGFLSMKVGFVEEFWVDPACRGQGHGSALLAAAEARFATEGCACVALTTDTVADFYHRRGYVHQPAVLAKNRADVYVKRLG